MARPENGEACWHVDGSLPTRSFGSQALSRASMCTCFNLALDHPVRLCVSKGARDNFFKLPSELVIIFDWLIAG